MKTEKRYISELQGEGNGRHITGYALLFNTRSVQLGDFVETIAPTALNQDIINRSDILCLLDHNIQKGVLARSRNGQGSLSLTLDEKGLKYEFDAPETALGDELLEGVRRGDIANSSFSFVVARDNWEQLPDGTYLRTILEFAELFDVSPVYKPAYNETSVDCRGLDELKKEIESRDMNKEENKEVEEKEEEQKPAEEPQTDEQPAEEEAPNSDDENENRADEEEKTEAEGDETKEDAPAEQPADDKGEDDVKEEETKADEKRNKTIAMKKQKFSLLKAIRSVVNGEQFDAHTAAVIAEGRSLMSAAGKTATGQIVLPIENRAEGDTTPTTPTTNGIIMAGVEGAGMENVAEDKLDLLTPLRNRMVLGEAGCTFLTGLTNDISIPVATGGNCAWKGEVVKADASEYEFEEITLKPKRLTCYLDVSKTFIAQDGNSANELLMRDMINCISEKLESTILGDEKGTNEKPQGLFYGVTADTAAVKFGDVVDWEADLENANINGEIKYIVNPSAKAILRKTAKDTGSGLFVMADGEIEGNKVLSTASVVKKGVLLGDMREIIVANWGSLDITLDPYTKATENQIRIVINFWVDAAVRRPAAFVKHILK